MTAAFPSQPVLATEAVAIQAPPSNSTANLQPDQTPLDLASLQANKPSNSVYTSTSFTNEGMALPSLWWMRDQFAAQTTFGKDFVKNWLVQPIQPPRPGRVDLVIDQEKWNQLDYLNRYQFISGFGMDAHRYGYNLRVFDERGHSLGASTCDFSQFSSASARHSGERAALPSNMTDVPVEAVTSEQPAFPLNLGQLTCRVSLNSSGRGMLRGGPNGGLLSR